MLLERKRKEEEEREKREREEKERLANMPAWKRGLIQKRRAKQEGGREKDRERDKESGFQIMDYNTGTQNVCDKEVPTVLLLEFGKESKPHSQVSVETIGPVRENPFVRYQDTRRRDREGEKGEEIIQESRMETEKPGEMQRKSLSHCTVWGKDRGAELTLTEITTEPSGKSKLWEDEAEEDRKQCLRHTSEGQGRRVDLKETLACGCTVSEINASGVLLIKPLPNFSAGAEGSHRQTKENDVEGEAERDEEKELRQTRSERESDGRSRASWFQKQRENQAWDDISRDSMRGRSRGTLKIEKTGRQHEQEGRIEWGMERKGQESALGSKDLDEGRGKVRQLLSKFGEYRKRPSRSKSTDCCDRTNLEQWNPQPRLSLGEKEDMEKRMRKGEDNHKEAGKGPKRSVSFSDTDRVFSDKEDLCKRGMQSVRTEITGGKEDSSERTTRRASSPNTATPRQSVVPEGPQVTQPTQSEGRVLKNTGKEREVVREIERETPSLMERSVQKDGDTEKEREDHRAPCVHFRRESALVFEVPFRQVPTEKAAKHEADEESQEEMQNVRVTGDQGRDREKGEHKWQDKESPVTLRRKDVGTRTCKTEAKHQQSITPDSEKVERNTTLLGVEQESPIQCDKINFRNSSSELFDLQCSIFDSEGDDKDRNPTSDAAWERQALGDTNNDKQKGRLKERETNAWMHTFSDNVREKHTRSDENCFRGTQREGRERDRPGSHYEVPREACTGGYTERKSDMKMQGPKIQIPKVPFGETDLEEEGGEMRLNIPSEKDFSEEEDWTGVVRRGSWKAGRPLTRIESLREKMRQKELEKQRAKMLEGGNVRGRWDGEGEQTAQEKVEKKEISMWGEVEKQLTDKGVQRATVEEEEPRGRQQKAILLLESCTPKAALQTGSPKHSSRFFSDTEREEERAFIVLCSHHMGPSAEVRAEEQISSVEECNTFHQIRQGTEDGTEDEEMLEELYDPPYLPPSLSPSPPASYSPCSPPSSDGTISPLCSPASSTFFTNTEKITANRVQLTVKIEHEHATNPNSSKTIPEKPLCSWKANQGLEPRINQQGCSEDAPEESAALQAAEEQLEQSQYSETKSQRMQNQERLQEEDLELYSRRSRPEEQQTHTNQKVQCLPRQHNQNVPPKRNQSKHTKSNFPTAVNPKSAQHPKNSLKIPKEGRNPVSSSPSPDSYSFQGLPAVQVRRGNTITITPRKAGGGESSFTSTEVTVTPPPARAADPHSAVHKNKKKYPAVEEIEVIGGYQSLEKSCLSRRRRPHKEANVCFDEVRLEQVCEYPSEMSVLAASPSPLLPGSERRRAEELEEEDEEEEQQHRGGSVFKSTRNVDESFQE
ncbi:phostensin [Arapaima gigas]